MLGNGHWKVAVTLVAYVATVLLLLYSLLIGRDLDWKKKTASFPRRLGKGNDCKEQPDIFLKKYDDVSMTFGQRMQTFWRTSTRQLVHDGEENAGQWAGG